MSETSSALLTTHTSRKLSRPMRIANMVYQLFMVAVSGINLLLLAIDKIDGVTIPELYFQIISVIIGVFPVVWSKFLDACKQIQSPWASQASSPVPSSSSPESSTSETPMNPSEDQK